MKDKIIADLNDSYGGFSMAKVILICGKIC